MRVRLFPHQKRAVLTNFRVSPVWGGITVASLAILGLLAPSGLWLLLFIGIIVITHEGGHLFAARRAGMDPTEFFWGFGPEVVGFDVGDCRYGLKAIFLGGYVKLWGMTPTSELPPGVPEHSTYRAASHSGRIKTILAGPFVNLATAVLAFTAANYLQGAGFRDALEGGLHNVWIVVEATGEALWLWVSDIGTYVGAVFRPDTVEAPVRFMSPVSQAQYTGQQIESGLVGSLQWFGILSCAIGIVNLLPLPPLDGGHAAVAATEKLAQVVRKSPSIRFNVQRLEPVAYVTVAALVLLSASALVMDLRDVM